MLSHLSRRTELQAKPREITTLIIRKYIIIKLNIKYIIVREGSVKKNK